MMAVYDVFERLSFEALDSTETTKTMEFVSDRVRRDLLK